MAVSPILLNSLPFDATLAHTLQFIYSGNQVFAHRIVVKRNDTLEVVYDSGQTGGMALRVVIPENTLTNGYTYNFQVSVFERELNENNEYVYIESPLSNTVILKCFATPSFGFANVVEGTTIRNSYIDVEVSYSCEDETEILNQYRVILYGSDKTTIIFDSGTVYATSGLITKISGLTDDTTYYLRATCETLSGMELDTGFIEVNCDYIKPDLFLAFYADNIPEEGLVRLSSNFVLIEGESSTEELVYIDDEKISLLNDETVWFDSGYNASNFTCDIVAENLKDFSKIISFDMKTVKAYVMWCHGIFEGEEAETYYAELVAYQYVGYETLNYIQMSNRIEPLADGEQVHFWIRHVNGSFDIKIAKLTAEETIETIEEGEAL